MNRGSKMLGSGKIRVFRTRTPVVLSSSRRLWPFLHAGFSSASAGRAVISNANTNATLLIQEVLQRVTRAAAPGACFAVTRRWGGGIPGSLAPILLKQIARFRFSLREIRDEPGKFQKPRSAGAVSGVRGQAARRVLHPHPGRANPRRQTGGLQTPRRVVFGRTAVL